MSAANAIQDDEISRLLREHYATEAADVGLRSLDLAGVGGGRGAYNYEASATDQRRLREREHKRIRAGLAALADLERHVLALAYQPVRWPREVRQKLGALGQQAGVALASPKAQRWYRMYLDSMTDDVSRVRNAEGSSTELALALQASLITAEQRGLGEWLLARAPEAQRQEVAQEALQMLGRARKAFAAAYQPPPNRPRLDAKPSRRVRRNLKAELIRSLAYGGVDGQSIPPPRDRRSP